MKSQLLLVLYFLSATAFGQQTAPTIAAPATAPHKPRIIALAPHIVEMLFAIGAGEQIIATSEFSDYPAAAKSIPRIGNYMRLQLERIVELQPDLIIAWRSGSPSDDLARLQTLGFQVVYSQPNSLEDIAKELRQFAELSGHSAQGQQLAEQYLAELAIITEQFQQKTPISVFYELWSQPLTTIAKDSWPQQHLSICGVTNPFFDAETSYPLVGIEQIIVKPIQLIIQPLSINQPDKQGFDWQHWPEIPAVKNQQIIQIDADKMHRMSVRSLEALKSLCEKIDAVRQFYQQPL